MPGRESEFGPAATAVRPAGRPAASRGGTGATAVFLVALLGLLAFSPWTIVGMGYNAEILRGADSLLSHLLGDSSGEIAWPRHGAVSVVPFLPHAALARLAPQASRELWLDRIASLQPAIETSLLIAFLYALLRRAGLSARGSCRLAFAALFGTMLWPYAYIGLETLQSASLMGLAYLAFFRRAPAGPATFLGLGAASILVLTARLTSLALLPAVAFALVSALPPDASLRRRLLPLGAIVAAVATVFSLLGGFRVFTIIVESGRAGLARPEPLLWALHAFSFFGSPNKSLFLFAPLLLVAALRLPSAFRAAPRPTVFALLVLGGLVAGFAPLDWWSEETWGPRYLHPALAPLILALGASFVADPPRRFERAATGVAVALGIAISFLGVLFYYGSLHIAAMRTDTSTFVALQQDPTWNALRFHSRLARLWLEGGSEPALFTPRWRYWWDRERTWIEGKSVDLRPFATPQPLLLRGRLPQGDVALRVLRMLSLACLLGAAVGLARGPEGDDPSPSRPGR
jgi:hypothetical protein